MEEMTMSNRLDTIEKWLHVLETSDDRAARSDARELLLVAVREWLVPEVKRLRAAMGDVVANAGVILKNAKAMPGMRFEDSAGIDELQVAFAFARKALEEQ
jgi:hypothetical protein